MQHYSRDGNMHLIYTFITSIIIIHIHCLQRLNPSDSVEPQIFPLPPLATIKTFPPVNVK